jgi:Phage integrase family
MSSGPEGQQLPSQRGRLYDGICSASCVIQDPLTLPAGPYMTAPPPVITALHTGFRTSELCSLTWNDVDFRRCTITVRAGHAKNGESRMVPMNEVLTATLKAVKLTDICMTMRCAHLDRS